MGGVKSEECNDMAFLIWSWCLTKGVWLSARHIPGAQNIEADQASRQFKESVEWSLSTGVSKPFLQFGQRVDTIKREMFSQKSVRRFVGDSSAFVMGAMFLASALNRSISPRY